MSSFFFLARVERVDFTRWYQDQNVDEALTKLIASLDLPTEPTRETISDELASFKAADDPEPTEETESPTPEIPLGDLAEMFFTASEVADDDPERAVFLYQQVLEIDPEYMGGEIQGFVDRELKRLLPKRIQNFEEQIVHEKMKGNWRGVKRLSQDLKLLDPHNKIAGDFLNVIERYLKGEQVYYQAKLALERNKQNAAVCLLTDLYEICPNYGDPGRLFDQLPRFTWMNILSWNPIIHTLQGHSDVVTALVIDSQRGFIISGSNDETVRIWNIENSDLTRTFGGHSGSVFSLSVDTQRGLIISGSENQIVTIWKVNSYGKYVEKQSLHGYLGTPRSLAVDTQRGLIISGSDDGIIRVWDIENSDLIHTMEEHFGSVLSLAVDSRRGLIISGSENHRLSVWDIETGEFVRSFKGHSGSVFGLIVDSQRGLIISSADDGTVRIWNILSGDFIHTLNGHTNAIRALAVDSQRGLVFSGSDDETVRIWSIKTGELVRTLYGHSSSVNALAIDSQRGLIVSASDDKTIKIWGA